MNTDSRQEEILKRSLEILIREFSPKKIYLFGSRAKKKAQEASDFDFALDCEPPGMAKKRQAREKLERVAGLYTVDLVFLSEVEPGFKKLVLKTGKILYEQKGS